uniref:Uncharacterized protein n=1 Tax=Timema monikensis TaxID=170555 RepID=A0A7R9HX45_9NEOP|nr:unnamed protein product [Timema monikensis]
MVAAAGKCQAAVLGQLCAAVAADIKCQAAALEVGLMAVAKAGLVAATRWGWLLLPANARLLLLGGVDGIGQGGAGGSD